MEVYLRCRGDQRREVTLVNIREIVPEMPPTVCVVPTDTPAPMMSIDWSVKTITSDAGVTVQYSPGVSITSTEDRSGIWLPYHLILSKVEIIYGNGPVWTDDDDDGWGDGKTWSERNSWQWCFHTEIC